MLDYSSWNLFSSKIKNSSSKAWQEENSFNDTWKGIHTIEVNYATAMGPLEMEDQAQVGLIHYFNRIWELAGSSLFICYQKSLWECNPRRWRGANNHKVLLVRVGTVVAVLTNTREGLHLNLWCFHLSPPMIDCITFQYNWVILPKINVFLI